jgi:hypothetical protein
VSFKPCHGLLFKNSLSYPGDLFLSLYSFYRNPNMVNPDMREGLAVSLVASYPKFAQKPVREDDKPWVSVHKKFGFVVL